MIIEFAVAATLSLPNTGPAVTQIEFSEPVREVITYPQVGVLERLSGLPLPEGTLDAFENEFTVDHIYFGAFAITKDFGYGYVTGANSIEAAREVAIEECLKQGPSCHIYAEIYPQGFEPLQEGQVSLAPEAGNYYQNPLPDWGSFRAMAISEDGAYSIVWNYGSPAEAAAAALSDCAGYSISDLPNLRSMPCILIPFK
jgi:hypothetical protein